MRLKILLNPIACAFVLLCQSVDAGEIFKQSGARTTAILELYTSEGCSNCPQAEKYLEQLNKQHINEKFYIPLAFHVDYWDYMGWEDPYSNPKHGDRQRDITIRNKQKSIYTPQFVLYGRDFPAHENIPKAIDIINNIQPRANIELKAKLENKELLEALISINSNDEQVKWGANIYIAIAEDHLSSNISDGENKGLSLKHNNVVRKLIGPIKMEGKQNIKINKKIILDKEWKLSNLTLVIFAEDNLSGTTHQSLQIALKDLQKK